MTSWSQGNSFTAALEGCQNIQCTNNNDRNFTFVPEMKRKSSFLDGLKKSIFCCFVSYAAT
jgi:hypothetical protein